MAMIISGKVFPPPGDPSPVSRSDAAQMPVLTPGDVLEGRVSQVKGGSEGLFRFPDGSSFAFSGAQGLTEGEMIRLEVVRLFPELAMRVAGSESRIAANLANNLQQSLVRVPDLFARLMNLVSGQDVEKGGALLSSARGQPLFLSLQPSASGKSGRALDLAGVLRDNLPNLSAEALLRGETAGLVRLLEGASREEVTAAVRVLREAAGSVRLAAGQTGSGGPAAESSEATPSLPSALHRLGDLLSMQNILPRVVPSAAGEMFLGYRVFWLNEGGLGEAIWRREKEKQDRKDKKGRTLHSVFLSLHLTRLGVVQSRVVFGDGLLGISVVAEEETTVSALRSRIAELRAAMVAADLPLNSLDLKYQTGAAMRQSRQEAIGLGGGFSAAV
ncbi:MAG: flagellar hook-length control protein FliK [Magnetococcales bacterium]|nr:flagellar hook-length control protein FliK [Magnetococcales bacterium]